MTMKQAATPSAADLDAADLSAPERPTARVGEWWAVVLGAALMGLGFTTIQIMEKITILKNPDANLVCNISARISCTDVLNAWQSSVLGPPNALIGAIMFAIFTSAALGGFLNSRFAGSFVATLWGLAVFFLSFATWFMYQTAFSIGTLCPWCVGITTAVVAICVALTRIADHTQAFGDTGFGRLVGRAVETRLDLALWAGWWLLIAVFLYVGLAL
jgi:uncharacterized membrane protein